MKYLLIFLLFASINLEAKIYSASQLSSQPKSLQKDFYIYLLLQKGVSKSEANALFSQVYKLSPKLKKAFTPYIDKFKRGAYCAKLKDKALLGRYGDCVEAGLSLYRATLMEPNLLIKIANSIHNYNSNLEASYKAISKKSFQALLDLPPKALIKTFNSVGEKFRKEHYDKAFPKELLQQLDKIYSFNQTVDKIVRENLPNLQKSLIEIDSANLNDKSNFLLGLNAVRYGQLESALRFFKLSQSKAKKIFERDKALFWQYLLTKNRSILKELTNSYDINLYTIYAYEELGQKPDNIIYSLDPKSNKTPFDIRDPFAWVRFKKEFSIDSFSSKEQRREYLLRYNSKWSEPYIASMLYNYKDKIRYFLTPYEWYLNGVSAKRKTLIYSLSRQESRCIPTEISTSYALGMMQFMPFLAKSVAKELGIVNFDYDMMFDPKTAFIFANRHLDYLQKYLNHPLFIAYAYNGGIGFARREILAKHYFYRGAYEPFMSMEMIKNAQARRYGKRVLANYAIYSKLFGVPKSLHSLLDMTLRSSQ